MRSFKIGSKIRRFFHWFVSQLYEADKSFICEIIRPSLNYSLLNVLRVKVRNDTDLPHSRFTIRNILHDTSYIIQCQRWKIYSKITQWVPSSIRNEMRSIALTILRLPYEHFTVYTILHKSMIRVLYRHLCLNLRVIIFCAPYSQIY